MGCGSSANQVHAAGDSALSPDPTAQSTPHKVLKPSRPRSKTVNVKPKAESDIDGDIVDSGVSRIKRQGSKQGWGSQESLGSVGSEDGGRGTSATSKFSHHSTDSGFADTEYSRVVTEFSEADKVKEVEENFNTPRNLGK